MNSVDRFQTNETQRKRRRHIFFFLNPQRGISLKPPYYRLIENTEIDEQKNGKMDSEITNHENFQHIHFLVLESKRKKE